MRNGNLWLTASLTDNMNVILQASQVLVKSKLVVELDSTGRSRMTVNDIPAMFEAQRGLINTLSQTVESMRANLEGKIALLTQENAVLRNRIADLEGATTEANRNTNTRLVNLETACVPGLEYEVRAATATSSRMCALLTTCRQGEYQITPPTLTSDRRCSNHTTCPVGSFEAVPATATSDRVCRPWTNCTSNQHEIVQPSSSTDRTCRTNTMCSIPTSYQLIPPTEKTDRVCTGTRQCTALEFQATPPTLTSDRICRLVSPACTATQYEAVSAIQVGDNQRDRLCLPLTVCNVTTQYELVAPTLSTDRRCANITVCNPQTQFQRTAPTPTSDRDCAALTTCTSSQFQLTAPTATSDRVCQNIRGPCAVGETETAPTPTSDRICTSTSGCSSFSIHSFRINDRLWLCSDGATTPKNWDRVSRVCNQAGGFRLPTVGPMTQRGRPDNTAWRAAASQMQGLGHDYFITGHPTRGASWGQWTSGWMGINGLGYIDAGELSTGSNWMALTDGNNNDLRAWPAANSPDAGHRLATLCANLADIPGVYVFANNIWRI